MTEPTTFDEAVERVFEECADLLKKKHHDYGPGNVLAFKDKGMEYVEFALVTRMSDKIARLVNLTIQAMKGDVKLLFETIEDTLLDLVNYAVIFIMVRRGWFELPFKEESKVE